MSQLPTKSNPGVYLPAPTSFEEAYRIAKVLAASDLVPKDYRDKPENCLVAMQWGADVGLPGLQALQNIAVINGRPSIWGDAALAIVKNHPSFVNIDEHIEGSGDQRVAVCIIQRKNQSEVKRTFSVENAKKAGLWAKSGPWQAYPERMLQVRARGFALRDAFPDALRGLSIAEESQDIEIEINPAPAKSAPEMPKAKSEAAPAAPQRRSTSKPAEKVDTSTGEIIDGQAREVPDEPQQQEAPQQPEQQPEPTKAKPEQQKTEGGETMAGPGLIAAIQAKAKAAEIPTDVLLDSFGLTTLEGITLKVGNEIMAWIRQQ